MTDEQWKIACPVHGIQPGLVCEQRRKLARRLEYQAFIRACLTYRGRPA